MKTNTNTTSTFWWINPWASARALSNQVRHLTGRLADEILANSDLRETNEDLTEEAKTLRECVIALELKTTQLEAKISELKKLKNVRRRRNAPTAARVIAACAQGLTIDEACEKYALKHGSAQTTASRLKVSFAWSGKGRKPAHRDA